MKSSFIRQGVYVLVFSISVLGIMTYISGKPSISTAANQFVSVEQVDPTTPGKQSFDTENFDIVMSVITHPRCINCHTTDEHPRQTDEQIIHLFNVTRGKDNRGGPVQTCETCHHEENNPYSLVPGASHWGLAPKSMGWLGLSEAEIAQALLDPTKNGNRSFDDLLHHMEEDALVLWAWEPGAGRTTPPVPHDEFVKALDAWLDAGAPIPSE